MKVQNLALTLALVALPALADGPSHAMKVVPDPKIAAALPPDLRKSWLDSLNERPKEAPASAVYGDITRIPYQSFRVYKVNVVPGSPLMIELPVGETARAAWVDQSWWKAESLPGSGRVLVNAIPAEGVIGSGR